MTTVVTAYIPDTSHWESDWKRRKKRHRKRRSRKSYESIVQGSVPDTHGQTESVRTLPGQAVRLRSSLAAFPLVYAQSVSNLFSAKTLRDNLSRSFALFTVSEATYQNFHQQRCTLILKRQGKGKKRPKFAPMSRFSCLTLNVRSSDCPSSSASPLPPSVSCFYFCLLVFPPSL